MSEFHRKLFSKFSDAEALLNSHEASPQPLASDAVDGFDYTSFQQYFEPEIYTDHQGYKFQTYYSPPANQGNNINPIIFVGHHGAGSTGLTFTALSNTLNSITLDKRNKYSSNPGFFTFDMRGHSLTHLLNKENNYNLSINTLVDDFKFIIDTFMANLTYEKYTLVFLGHSLGGSVLCNYLRREKNPFVKGIVLVDIVESTAINSISKMSSYLNALPTSFNSLGESIRFHIDRNLINNKNNAELSIPYLMRKEGKKYKFIIDLKKTEKFWYDWFVNLNENFLGLSSSINKVLILANNDYLDKQLIIGQMQGKFQLIIFNSINLGRSKFGDSNNVSHFLHEDIPHKLSLTLLEFIERVDENFYRLDDEDNNVQNLQMDLLKQFNEKWASKKT